MKFLYDTLGKWGVVGLMAVGGLGAVLVGVSQLVAKLSGNGEPPPAPRKKKKRIREEDPRE